MTEKGEPSLGQKLGVRPGSRIRLVGTPPELLPELRTARAEAPPGDGTGLPCDIAMIFARSAAELRAEFRQSRGLVVLDGMIWACWPKRTSGVATDLDDHVVRGIGLQLRWVDVKVCAVSTTWSGLKFVRRRADRARANPPGDGWVLDRASVETAARER
jgi:hypothetical protein